MKYDRIESHRGDRMNLLVSDYDGTLNPDVTRTKSTLENIRAVNQYREQGNKFMLSTGRSFESIKKQIDRFDIKYDYLSCNDGAILFDNNNQILTVSYLNIELIKKLSDDLLRLDSVRRFDYYGTHGVTNGEEILELAIYTRLFNSSLEIKKLIKGKYKELDILSFPFQSFVKAYGGKTRTINYIIKNINIEKVITVGDSINDLEMLIDFNGYKVIGSSPKLYFKDIKTCSSVKNLIKKINK